MELGKSAVAAAGLSSPAVQMAQQLTWYSEQLEVAQNNARRLQRESDRVARENRQLTEQTAEAKAEAKSLRTEAKEAKDATRRLRLEQHFPTAATGGDARYVALFCLVSCNRHVPCGSGTTDTCAELLLGRH